MGVRNEFGVAPLAITYLETLHAELARRGLESELATSGSWPRRLRIPGTPGDAFDDNVVASESGGRWMFWRSWRQPISTADDLEAVTGKIATVLRSVAGET